MSPMVWFQEYLSDEKLGSKWDARADLALRICMRSADDEALAQYVIDCADTFIREDVCVPGNAKALFFALEKTGDEKYGQAIQRVMAQLDAQPEEADAPLSALYETLPFRMTYEMKLNRMERVGQTAAMFRAAHQRCKAMAGNALREEAWFLLALTDGIAVCTEQLYEHWRALVDIYRERLKQVLGMLSEADPHTLAIVLWALLSGVQLGIIDPERYLPVALKALSELRACGEVQAAEMLEEVFEVSACLK